MDPAINSDEEDTEVVFSADLAEVASSADLAELASLADLAGYVTTGVEFQEKCDVPSGSFFDFYDGHNDENPDYDDPGDFDSYHDVYGFIGPDEHKLYHDLHGPDDCGVYCVSRGDVGVTPYWTGVEECDVYEGDVVLPQTGSGQQCSYICAGSSGWLLC